MTIKKRIDRQAILRYVDVEERKKALAQNEMEGQMFIMKDDPRVTLVGRFIRMTTLDELSQLWNALKGEMNLEETQLPTLDEVAHYDNWQRKRICINPWGNLR